MREYLEIRLDKLTLKIDKRSGVLSFISKNGELLLSENKDTSRQYNSATNTWWNYFDWTKKEILSARGEDDLSWTDLGNAAKYISHGEKSGRTTIFMSTKGYQILIPSGIKVMSCTVKTYSNYLCFENSDYIDYIFRTAR